MRLHGFWQLDELFKYRGDAAVLACLASGPMRFSEVARAIPSRFSGYRSGYPVGPNLARLQAGGLVAHAGGDEQYDLYKLTSLGEEKAQMVLNVLRALENHPRNPQEH